MKIKKTIVKGLAIYGVVSIAKDLYYHDSVAKIEKIFNWKNYYKYYKIVKGVCRDENGITAVFGSKTDAYKAMSELTDILAARGFITIEDFLDLVDSPSTPFDSHYGWRTLEDVDIVRVHHLILDKYEIRMPKAKKVWPYTAYTEHRKEYVPYGE